jgi:hypothetical protein
LHRCSCATPGQIGGALLQVAQCSRAPQGVAVHDRIRIGARAHCAWLGSRWPPGEIVGKPGLDTRMLSHSRAIGGVDRDAAAVPAQKRLVGAAGGAAGNGKQAKSKRQHRAKRMPNVHAPRLRSRQHRLARPARSMGCRKLRSRSPAISRAGQAPCCPRAHLGSTISRPVSSRSRQWISPPPTCARLLDICHAVGLCEARSLALYVMKC